MKYSSYVICDNQKKYTITGKEIEKKGRKGVGKNIKLDTPLSVKKYYAFVL